MSKLGVLIHMGRNQDDQSRSNIINQKNKAKGLFSFPMGAIVQAHAISVVRIRRERDSGM
jgi:hypothetical protein